MTIYAFPAVNSITIPIIIYQIRNECYVRSALAAVNGTTEIVTYERYVGRN